MCSLTVVFWQTAGINLMLNAQLHFVVGSISGDLIFPFIID